MLDNHHTTVYSGGMGQPRIQQEGLCRRALMPLFDRPPQSPGHRRDALSENIKGMSPVPGGIRHRPSSSCSMNSSTFHATTGYSENCSILSPAPSSESMISETVCCQAYEPATKSASLSA